MLVSSHKIQTVLSRLAKKRPVFHSEADFQHALAWELQLESPDAQIRLEKQVATHGSRVYLDLLFQSGDVEIAIEIKYKTRHGKFLYSGEEFALRNQSAQDIGRHDFIKDIQRLERYLQSHNNAVGFAVFLTNDQSYWNEPKKSDAVDTEFRISRTPSPLSSTVRQAHPSRAKMHMETGSPWSCRCHRNPKRV
jgi:hypothetical protein